MSARNLVADKLLWETLGRWKRSSPELDRIQFLKTVPFFDQLSNRQLKSVSDIMFERTYETTLSRCLFSTGIARYAETRTIFWWAACLSSLQPEHRSRDRMRQRAGEKKRQLGSVSPSVLELIPVQTLRERRRLTPPFGRNYRIAARD
jgi:hypothetical protein